MSMTQAQLDEIKARCEAATPGPWVWDVNSACKEVSLVEAKGEWNYVMKFTRWGTQGAIPRLPVNGIMERADKMLKSFPGKEHHIGFDDYINHPNAEFIARARADIPALLAEVERLREENNKLDGTCENLADENVRLREAQQWIPVSERLPAENGNYLVTYRDDVLDNYVIIRQFWNGKFASMEQAEALSGRKAIAWMPLPEPYQIDLTI